MRLRQFWVLVLVVLILAGCAAKEAKQVARLTLNQVNTYEGHLDKKIDAEKVYAQITTSYLSESLTRAGYSTQLALVVASAQDFQGEMMAQKHEIQEKDLKNGLSKTLQAIRQSREQYQKGSLEYAETLSASLSGLELQKGSLKKVRNGLEQLQNDANARQALEEWITFGIKTKEEFDRLSTQKSSQ